MGRVSQTLLVGAHINSLESEMTRSYRLLLSVGILLVDLLVFFLPLTALFLIYILMVNPPWFREFLNRLDQQE
jgi:hypothetical protein